MCTFWAVETPHGLLCGANRDESRLRGRGLAPVVHSWTTGQTGSVRALAPTDSDAGGTWVAVSEGGLVVALLNNYRAPSQTAAEPVRSRGLLVPDLALHANAALAAQWLRAQTDLLRHTRPFEVGLVAPGQPLVRLLWDGATLQEEALALPAVLASSAWAVDAVRQARTAELPNLLAALGAGADLQAMSQALQQTASDHTPGPGKRPTCLHRLVAKTVSHTQILVGVDRVQMAYVAGNPCRTHRGPWLTLVRKEV